MGQQPFRVFIVEDHAATARGLKLFLELAGYVVTIATSMRAALERAERSAFDVLVCDLNLPDGTGWELMESLRKKLPVRGIVFSAFDEPEHFARSKAAGFDEHVVKGTTPEALLAAIDRIARFELPSDALTLRTATAARIDGVLPRASTPRKRSGSRKRSSAKSR